MQSETRTTERAEAERLQREALEKLEIYREALIARCRRAMRALYQERLQSQGWLQAAWVNGDDATLWLDGEECECDRRVIGAVFRSGSGWAYVTTVKSALSRRHGRRISCWRWVGE